MRKKSLYILIAILLVGLSGGVYYVTVLGAPNNHQNTLQEVKKNSETKPLQGDVPKSALKNSQTYEVPAKDEKSSSYVSSGAASKVGEYTISPQGNEAKLAAKSDVKATTLTNGVLQYAVTSVKKMANSPRTQEALDMAQMALNSRDITGDYTTLIVSYTVQNTGNQAAITDGVSAGAFADGSVVSAVGGLDNDATLTQKPIAAGETRSTFAVLLVPSKLAATVNEVTLQFASATDENHQQLVDASDKLTVKF